MSQEEAEPPTDTQPSWNESYIVAGLTNITHRLVLQSKAYLEDVVEHLILAIVLYVLLCLLLYACIVRWKKLSFSDDVRVAKRVLFVIAHPDDECMFFGPTVLNLCRRKDCTVYLLCLTTGNGYGLGKTRKRELYDACATLRIEDTFVSIINHTLLPDSLTGRWPTDLASQIILQQIETYRIDTLVTFDKHGVSYHPNHCSCYLAVAYLVVERRLPDYCNVFTLETINVFRKYWLILDLPISIAMSRYRFILSLADRRIIHAAMRSHRSQLLWFRRIYMWFSRYMMINTLQKMDLVDVELDLELDD